MGFLLLAFFIAAEAGLLVYTLCRQKERFQWRRNRLIVRIGEMLLFLAALLLPQAAWDLRFKLCFCILCIRLVWAAVIYFVVYMKMRRGLGETETERQAADSVEKNALVSGEATCKEQQPIRKKAGARVALSAIGGVLVLALSLVPAFVFTGYAGLKTTGMYEVAQARAILVDDAREECFETDGSKREVPVYFYYPKGENTGKNSFPLVVFSHGAFGYYESNTSTYMELASHGYVVVSLDHPYHSFFTKDTEGKTITVNPAFLQEVMYVNGETTPEREIYELSTKWLSIRTADMEFALDSITSSKEHGIKEELWVTESEKVRQELERVLAATDTEKIGLMGHSLGGATSVTVGRSREDIGAVIDLDGTMLGEQLGFENGEYIHYEEAYPVPLLSVESQSHHEQADMYAALYVNNEVLKNAVNGHRIYFADSAHMNFTDLPLFSPVLAGLLGTGEVDVTECIVKMNEIVLQFLDYYLKGQGELNLSEMY